MSSMQRKKEIIGLDTPILSEATVFYIIGGTIYDFILFGGFLHTN